MASQQRVHVQFVKHVAKGSARQRPQCRSTTERVVDLIDLTCIPLLAALAMNTLDHGGHGGLELSGGGTDHNDVLILLDF